MRTTRTLPLVEAGIGGGRQAGGRVERTPEVLREAPHPSRTHSAYGQMGYSVSTGPLDVTEQPMRIKEDERPAVLAALQELMEPSLSDESEP